MTRYRATYGGRPCIASEEGDGRTALTVQYDKDPGFGSMFFTRVGRTQVELIEELPPLPPLTPEQRKRLGL